MPIIRSVETIDEEQFEIFIDTDQIIPSSESPYEDLRDSQAQKAIASVHDFLGEAMDLSRKCALQAVSSIKKFDKAIAPDEFEFQIGVKFSAEVGAVLTKIGSEAQLQITMKWIHNDKK